MFVSKCIELVLVDRKNYLIHSALGFGLRYAGRVFWDDRRISKGSRECNVALLHGRSHPSMMDLKQVCMREISRTREELRVGTNDSDNNAHDITAF